MFWSLYLEEKMGLLSAYAAALNEIEHWKRIDDNDIIYEYMEDRKQLEREIAKQTLLYNNWLILENNRGIKQWAKRPEKNQKDRLTFLKDIICEKATE